jgi:ATP-dependent helicase HrpB
MIQSDNALEDVGLVIFDEFHERSIHADLALALCQQIQQILRNDLRILIMSATIDSERIADILKAPVISSKGKQYPVSLRYLPPDKEVSLANSVLRVIRKALAEERGDVLVFFPGTGDIHRVMELLENGIDNVSIHPLYGDLSFKKQQEAIMPNPGGQRKVVLATSIAETSLTIEGVSVVIDSGFARVPKFDPRSGLTRLETVRVTRDAADQRAGRAGRLGPGICYRLWAEASHQSLVATRQPEVLEADLAPMILELFNWGVKNVNDLSWLTPLPSGAVNQAMQLLQELGAIEQNTITSRGRKMAELPTHPRISHMLLESGRLIGLATRCCGVIGGTRSSSKKRRSRFVCQNTTAEKVERR